MDTTTTTEQVEPVSTMKPMNNAVSVLGGGIGGSVFLFIIIIIIIVCVVVILIVLVKHHKFKKTGVEEDNAISYNNNAAYGVREGRVDLCSELH